MRIAHLTWLLFAGCASQASPKTSSVELPQQLPAPVATVSVALPQSHALPPRHSAHEWKPPTPKNPPDVTQARQYFMRGVQAYSAGDYAQAELEFETAYSYSPHEAVLFNIAASLEHSNRTEEAIDVYERYADTHPSNESDARKKIEALRKP